MKVLVVGDSDSYIKWGAHLVSTMPTGWSRLLVVLRSPVTPSAAQLRAALADTLLDPADAVEVALADLGSVIAAEHPDVILAAVRGPVVRVVARAVRSVRGSRPVVLSGLPGITIPAAQKAIDYRGLVDMVVLHSRREVREFSGLAEASGREQRFGLATLPFIPRHGSRGPADGDIIFASQAMVPRSREDRLRLLGWLAECARRHPRRRVVVKVRAVAGEAQTHAEQHDFAELLGELALTPPGNLVVEGGPMADHLARAGALVTVSSTAAIEAVALGIPCLLLDDFGVSAKMINVVFEGSGMFGNSDDLVNARFHSAQESWLADNYLHGASGDDWMAQLDALLELRAGGRLAWRLPRDRVLGGELRRAWDRKRALGRFDTTPSGYLAWGIGVPARGLVRAARRLRARRALT